MVFIQMGPSVSEPMNLTDTIVAVATPAGYSSIAVIRVSGDQAINYAKTIFSPNECPQEFQAYSAHYGKIVDPNGNETVDRVVATFFRSPHSYTGEDVIEFSCHGNPLIVDRIMKLLTGLGARIAERGEFTRRALLNGKIDLLQAEAVLDAVYAPCDEARRVAIDQYEGRLSKKLNELGVHVVDLLTLIEANIDFPDEDVTHEGTQVTQRIEELIGETDRLLEKSDFGLRIREGYKTLIIGRANVGKSTLFNQLVGYDRAITHERPGTTRDYIEEGIEVSGIYLRLFDTAGFCSQAHGPDDLAQQKSQALIEQADLVIMMFDASEPMNEEDIRLYNLTRNKKKMLVVNKIDLNIKLHDESILLDSIKLSAKTGQNIDLLKEKIKQALFPKISDQDILLTRPRHIQAVERARQFFRNACATQNLETMAFELHCALDAIGELTGRVMRKDILNRIFDEFCIGK